MGAAEIVHVRQCLALPDASCIVLGSADVQHSQGTTTNRLFVRFALFRNEIGTTKFVLPSILRSNFGARIRMSYCPMVNN